MSSRALPNPFGKPLDNRRSSGQKMRMTMLDARSVPHLNEVRLADYRPPDWLVPQIHLDFALDAERTIVKAVLNVTRNGGHDRPLRLDGDGLDLLSLKFDGADRQPQMDGAQLVIDPWQAVA